MKKLFAVVAALLIAGCAATSTTPPQSLDEGLAYAEGQVTAFELSAAQSPQLKAGVLQQVLTIGDQATAAIKAARVSEGAGDLSTAQGKLAAATLLLSQLAALLQANGVK